MLDKDQNKFVLFIMFIVVLLLCVFFMSQANASRYIDIGYGQSVHERAPNGTWRQEGFPYQWDLADQSGSIGIGNTIFRRERWSMDAHLQYVNHGDINGWNWFVSDENYNPSASPNPCNDPCEATRYGYFTGTAKATTLSIRPAVRLFSDVEAYAMLGLTYYRAKFVSYATAYRDPYKAEHMAFLGVYRDDKQGFTGSFGFGLRLNGAYVQVEDSPNLYSTQNSASRGIRRVSVGYQFGF